MKKLLIALVLLLSPASAWAQCTGIFAPNTYCGNNSASPAPPAQISGSTSIIGPGSSTVGDLALWNNLTGTSLKDSPPAAFTRTNDTNVTATLGGSPNTALVNAMSITFGWSGTLAAGRLNANVVQAFTNDTNVTATISAQNATLGWTGTLSAARGGTGADNHTDTGFATWSGGVLGSVGSSATVLPLVNGGTGSATQQAALNAVAPTPSRTGDLIIWNGSNWVDLPGNNSGTQLLQETSVGAASWVTVSGTGTVTTPGAGLVSGVTTGCSQSANQSTLSSAHCANAQTGTTYAILDADRAKLITASNAAAQAYTIAAAGAASAFQSGWYTDIHNISTNPAGIVTVTPATSTIDGQATLIINPGQSVRIQSDGTNYQTFARQLTNATLQSNTTGQNPTATVSGTGLMMGLGTTCTITPQYSTRIFVNFQGQTGNNTSSATNTLRIRYGTSTAPSNGAALTGTQVGAVVQSSAASSNFAAPFAMSGIITGLTAGTAYWLDMGLGVSGGSGFMQNVSCNAMEF